MYHHSVYDTSSFLFFKPSSYYCVPRLLTFVSKIVDNLGRHVSASQAKNDDALKYGTQQGLEQGMKEGLEQGMKKGMEIGMQQGMQQGMEKGMEKGMGKGMEKGMEKGRTDMSFKIAKELKSLNYPSADISKATGLTIEQIDHRRNRQTLWSAYSR